MGVRNECRAEKTFRRGPHGLERLQVQLRHSVAHNAQPDALPKEGCLLSRVRRRWPFRELRLSRCLVPVLLHIPLPYMIRKLGGVCPDCVGTTRRSTTLPRTRTVSVPCGIADYALGSVGSDCSISWFFRIITCVVFTALSVHPPDFTSRDVCLSQGDEA